MLFGATWAADRLEPPRFQEAAVLPSIQLPGKLANAIAWSHCGDGASGLGLECIRHANRG